MKQTLKSLSEFIFSAEKKETVRTLLISEGFGFCLSLSFVWGYELDHVGTVCRDAGQIFLIILMTLLVDQVLSVVAVITVSYSRYIRIQGRTSADAADQKDKKSNKAKKDDRHKIKQAIPRKKRQRLFEWGIVSLVLTLLWLPIYLAYFPAVFSYDAEAQLYQVITGSYNTHHPLIHTLIMGAFMKIGYMPSGINTGMALYSAVQMVITAMAVGASLTFPWRVKRPFGKKAVMILTAFFGIFPTFGILAVSTTKDIYFAAAALLMTVLLIDRPEGIGRYVAIGGAAFAAMLFRNNAGYALAVMVVILVLFVKYPEDDGEAAEENETGEGQFIISDEGNVISLGRPLGKRRPWKLIITLSLAFLLSVTVQAGLKSMLHAESGSPREALSIPIQQLARVKMLHNDELSEELRSDLNLLIDDEWADRYDEHLADPIKERISMKQPAVFIKTWIRLGLKYPGTYLDAWLKTTEGAWYIPDRSCNRIYGEGRETGFGYLSTDIRNMPDGFTVTENSKLPALRSALEGIVSDNSFENIPVLRLLFAPALYFWMLILYVYIQIMRRKTKELLPALFLLIYYLTILLSPAILVRYMLPFMLASPILLAHGYRNVVNE